MRGRRWAAFPRLAFYVGVVVASAVSTVMLADPNGRQSGGTATVIDARQIEGPTKETTEHELVVVFVGGATCPASRNEGVRGDLKTAGQLLARLAADNGWRLRRIGVAISAHPGEGMQFLERMGTFDEGAVGGGRSNSGLLRYVYGQFPGPMFMPQMVVLLRPYNPNGRIDREVEIERFVGQQEIARWAANGAPLPVIDLGQ